MQLRGRECSTALLRPAVRIALATASRPRGACSAAGALRCGRQLLRLYSAQRCWLVRATYALLRLTCLLPRVIGWRHTSRYARLVRRLCLPFVSVLAAPVSAADVAKVGTCLLSSCQVRPAPLSLVASLTCYDTASAEGGSHSSSPCSASCGAWQAHRLFWTGACSCIVLPVHELVKEPSICTGL